VMSGEGVEGSHVVNDASCILGRKLGVAVSGGDRRIVGPVWAREKAHGGKNDKGIKRRK
jgi:hypothetical protein